MKELLIASAIVGLFYYLKTRKLPANEIKDSWITPAEDYKFGFPITETTGESKVMSYRNIIMLEATNRGIDPAIIASIIYQESKGEPDTKTFEANVLDYSWGLMQIRGATAEWLDFKGDKNKLLDPRVNIFLGVKYLSHQLDRYIANSVSGNPVKDAISAYNAGTAYYNNGVYSNQTKYVTPVLKEIPRFRTMFNNYFAGYKTLFPTDTWQVWED